VSIYPPYHVTTIRTASDATKGYQELIRELDGLGKALADVNSLRVSEAPLNDIKLDVLGCQDILKEFSPKTEEFQKRLGALRDKRKALAVKERLL
jgi:hypothetical protein